MGIDLETCDKDLRKLGPGVRRGAYIAGISVAIEDGPCNYSPIRHLSGDNLPLEEVMAYVKGEARRFRGTVGGANLPYEIDFLAEAGVEFHRSVKYRDVQIADPLIYELHQDYDLDTIASRWGFPGKDESLLRGAAQDRDLDPKADLWKLEARYVGPYAEQDARLPLQILRRQEQELERQGLWEVYELESAVLPVLVRMRRRGVRIDGQQLDRIEAWTLETERHVLDEIKRLSGYRLALGEVGNPSILAPVLKSIGVVLPKTAKTKKDQIDIAVLDGMTHPLGLLIKQARKVLKLRTTFIAGVRRFTTADGRLHGILNQLRQQRDFEADGTSGAAYGRLAGSKPNLQNQPARDDFPIAWRSIYLPEEGAFWSSPDFSSQEPRLFVHLAIERGARHLGRAAFESAKALAARYHSDAALDFHAETSAATGGRVARKPAKTIGLGLAYGMGEARLCSDIGLPTSRAVWDFEKKARCYLDENPTRYTELCKRRLAENEANSTVRQDGDGSWPAAGPEGREVLERFNAGVPFLKKLAKVYADRAEEMGAIRTISGRLCHFPLRRKSSRGSGKYDFTHKAFNRAVQGSAGCQTKKALVDMDNAGLAIMLQVHDEIPVSVADLSEAKRAAEIMENAWPLHVPSRVDYAIGNNWAEAK